MTFTVRIRGNDDTHQLADEDDALALAGNVAVVAACGTQPGVWPERAPVTVTFPNGRVIEFTARLAALPDTPTYDVQPCSAGCGASIIWAVGEVTGSPMPLDALPAPGGFAELLPPAAAGEKPRYRMVPGTVPGRGPDDREDLRTSHYRTCPKRARRG